MKIIKYLCILLSFSYTSVYAYNFIGTIFSEDYASAYDGSDLMINGPQTNLDLTLLQIKIKNKQLSYLRSSGTAELLLTRPIDSNNNSNIAMSNLELQTFASIKSWAHAFIDANIDPDTLNNQLSSYFATLGNLNKSPFYLTLGKYYVPFGAFNDATLDSLQDNIAQFGGINAKSINIGFNPLRHQWFSLRLFGYQSNTIIHKKHTNQAGFNVDFSRNIKNTSIDIGTSFVTNISDSDAFVAAFGDDTLQTSVPGLDIYASIGLPFNITSNVEYIGATKPFDQGDMTFDKRTAKPSIIGLELSKHFSLFHNTLTSSIGYNQSYQSLGLSIPKKRLYLVVTFRPMKRISLSAQINDDTGYVTSSQSNIHGSMTFGSQKNHKSAYMQLSVYF